MLKFAGEVVGDLIGLAVNPDAEPLHPMARTVAIAAITAVLIAAFAGIYAEDGVIVL